MNKILSLLIFFTLLIPVSFSQETGSVTDIEGNSYNTVKIGEQWWMAENLASTQYNDGTPITRVSDGSAWNSISSPAYCWYFNDEANKDIFGALYNGHVIETNELCPTGWHVPTDDEWKELEIYLGMNESETNSEGWRGTDEGYQLKSTSGWYSGGNGSNSRGFNAIPAGVRTCVVGAFVDEDQINGWWSSTHADYGQLWLRQVHWDQNSIGRNKSDCWGFSVRCIKESDKLQEDSLALVDFYHSTNGENWINNSNWLSGPINTWYGVVIESSRVTQLNLYSNNLTGTLPSSLGKLSGLKGLALALNYIHGTIPDELYELTKLFFLGFGPGNYTLEGEISSDIGNLTELETLNLSANNFSGNLPSQIYSLPKLKNLILSFTQIENIDLNAIGDMMQLEDLQLAGLNLTGGFPVPLYDLTNLTRLDLSRNQFTGTISSDIGQLSKLRSLYLYSNNFDGVLPEQVNQSNLQDLRIHNNSFTGLPYFNLPTFLFQITAAANNFTFEDLEPNIGIPSNYFSYSPQANIGVEQHISIDAGDSYSLSVTCGGIYNQYQWYKDGILIPGAESDELNISDAQLSDNGTYICEVSNTVATDLIIHSNPIHIEVSGGEISQTISLNNGWNIFSLHLTPEDPAMMSIVQPLRDEGSLVKIQDEEGAAIEYFAPLDIWINNIGDWENTEGYKIRVNDNTSLNVTGMPIELPLTIPLRGGWNIVSYPVATAQDAMTALDELIVSDNLVKVQDEEGAAIEYVAVIDFWINNIHNFLPNEGYKVRVIGDDDLTLTTPAKSFSYIENETGIVPSAHFARCWKGNGLDHMNIYLDLANSGLQMGDEIGIFDGELCVGSGTITDPNLELLSMVASADDPTTKAIDGFTEGNSLQLKFWNSKSGEEYVPAAIKFINGTKNHFEAMGTAVIELNSSPNSLDHLDNPITGLGMNYPNPFAQATTIPFTIGKETDVDIRIYDILGQEVALLVRETYKPGSYKVDWEISSNEAMPVMPGIYFVRLMANDQVFIQSLEVLRK